MIICVRCGTSDGSTGKLKKFVGNVELGPKFHCENCRAYMMQRFNLDERGVSKAQPASPKMIDYTNLKRYAEKLVRDSAPFSLEEHVGVRIMTLMEHAHDVESILALLQRDIKHDKLDGEDTTALEAAVKKIQGV